MLPTTIPAMVIVIHTLIVLHLIKIDIDECAEETDGCEHTCTNTISSYYCSCYIGFALETNLHSCDGKNSCIVVHFNMYSQISLIRIQLIEISGSDQGIS